MPEPFQPKRTQHDSTREATNKTPNSITPPPGLTLLHTLQSYTGWVRSVAWAPDGSRLASSVDSSVRLWDPAFVRLLLSPDGHTDRVNSLAWAPDGTRLASGSRDTTIRLWDPDSGRLLSSLRGHAESVESLAWAPDGTRLASGSRDRTVCLWDPDSGRLLSSLGGHFSLEIHTFTVGSLTWSPDGTRLASGSGDTIRLWDSISTRFLSLLRGHTDRINSLAWSSDGTRLASGSDDRTVCLWDPDSGRLLSSLEGHTQAVRSLAWAPDGSLLASASVVYSLGMYINGEVRVWRTDTWEPVAVLTGLKSEGMVAWHPRLPLLATGGTRKEDILIWHVDLAHLLKRAPGAETVQYKNAKVVLVGESGVGKSGLALVLTGQPFAATESTHGRQVRLLDAQEVRLDERRREQRETWLWDLAGQKDYRLIHQLHLHEATVALIVFDAGKEGDALAGIRYWQRALRLAQQARGSGALPLTTFLVAARMDRGGREVSRERIEAVARELGCAGYIETSAKTNLGVEELRQAIGRALNWSNLPGVTSTTLLQDIKKSVLEEVQAGQLLRTVDELYQTFLRASNISRPDAGLRSQFETVLGRLQAQGVLRLLSFGNLVLLQSERLDAYASALLIAVRNEADGLGIISEELVQRGQFPVPQEDRIADRVQEQLLLLAMIEELVRQELVLREGGYLLFPSQATQEHPEQAELSKQLSVIFSIAGPVLSMYTTLVVRLAHSGIFQKQELWQRVVTYTTRLGGKFSLMLIPKGEEQADLGLFFDAAAREEMRLHFEDFVQQHLERAMGGEVPRRRQFVCPQCGEVFSPEQVSRRRARGFDTLRCPTCDTEVSLLDGIERLTSQPVSQVKKMEEAADTQRDRQSAISVIEGKRATKDFDVFLCHNGQDKPAVKQMGQQLVEHGILPWLDEWELRPGLPWQRTLEEQIDKIKAAAVFVGKNGQGPWQQHELDAFMRAFVKRGCPVIPVLLPDAPQEPALPVFLQAMTWVDFRSADPDPMQQLIWGITGQRDREEWIQRGSSALS